APAHAQAAERHWPHEADLGAGDPVRSVERIEIVDDRSTAYARVRVATVELAGHVDAEHGAMSAAHFAPAETGHGVAITERGQIVDRCIRRRHANVADECTLECADTFRDGAACRESSVRCTAPPHLGLDQVRLARDHARL